MGGEPSPNTIKPSLCILIALSFLVVPSVAATAPYVPNQANLVSQHALDTWVFALGEHENCPQEGIIDSNGLRSYGRFCFQFATFKRYARKYNLLPNTEDDELMNVVADYDIQRELVLRIIQEPYGYDNWRNTVKKIGKPPIVSTGA